MDHSSSELCFLLPPASCSTGGSLLPIVRGVAGGGGALWCFRNEQMRRYKHPRAFQQAGDLPLLL